MLPLNMNFYLARFFMAIGEETVSGRLGTPDSINWVNPKGLDLPIEEVALLVPTHGNFAGPGYSCGQRGEFTKEQMEAYPVWQIFDPTLGYYRNDYVDTLAKAHDLAYKDAEGQPDYWQKIKAADQALIAGMQALLDGTSPLFADGGSLTTGERNYGQSLVDAFLLKLTLVDETGALIEDLISSGFGLSKINDFLNSISQLRNRTPDLTGLPDMMAPWTDLFDAGASIPPPRIDPLIVDLDGDGVETMGVNNGAYFDHDGNGFAEKTGWADSDDGLLVMDRNNDGIINNGGELFGDQTLLQNGTKATDGFQALAELDTNADGVINASDSSFAQLKIWQDLDGDGRMEIPCNVGGATNAERRTSI